MFAQADLDKDGILKPNEALAYFPTLSVPSEFLQTVLKKKKKLFKLFN
jgi:hypothetical protein